MIRVRRLRRRSLDLELPAGTGFSVRLVERPGAWMSDAELDTLLARVRAVVHESVAGGTLDYGVARGDRDVLARTILTLGYRSRPRRPVALNALVWLPVTLHERAADVLHLGLTLVRPEARSRGLSHRLYFLPLILALLRHRLAPLWISNVSQVPSAVGQVAENFADVFPGAESDAPGPDHRAIASQLFERHRSAFGVGDDASFDADRFVIQNAYTGGSDHLKKTFDQATKHRLARFNDLCATTLDYGRGDDFLQVGRYTRDVLWRSIREAGERRVRVDDESRGDPAFAWFVAHIVPERTEL